MVAKNRGTGIFNITIGWLKELVEMGKVPPRLELLTKLGNASLSLPGSIISPTIQCNIRNSCVIFSSISISSTLLCTLCLLLSLEVCSICGIYKAISRAELKSFWYPAEVSTVGRTESFIGSILHEQALWGTLNLRYLSHYFANTGNWWGEGVLSSNQFPTFG